MHVHQKLDGTRASLPFELWTLIFNQSNRAEDASAWAEAWDIDATDMHWRSLVRERSSDLFALVPKPEAAIFQAKGRASDPLTVPRAIDWDDVLDAQQAVEENDAQPTQNLFGATCFMLSFAPRAEFTRFLIQKASAAWVLQNENDDDAALAEGDIACSIESSALTHATALTLDLTDSPGNIPSYCAGLVSVQTLVLQNLSLATNVGPLLQMPGLKELRLEGHCQPEAVTALASRLSANILLQVT